MNGKTIHLGTLTQTCCDLPTFIAGFCAMCGAAAKEQTMTSTTPQKRGKLTDAEKARRKAARKTASVCAWLDREGIEYTLRNDYSGRAMFGRTSSVALTVGQWDGPRTPVGKALKRRGFACDNLGMGYIYYTTT